MQAIIATIFASAQSIATLTVGIAQDYSHPNTATVTAYDDGELKIAPTTGPEITQQLNQATFELIKNKIIALSAADVVTTHSQIVCEMMPLLNSQKVLSVRSGFDYNTTTFTGDLKIVDNNAGCWQTTHIAPKNSYDVQTAKELETALQTITLQTVGN